MFNPELFGTATVGEKGQIVIPAEARSKLNIKCGDKLLIVLGPGKHALMALKSDMVKEIAKKMSEKFKKIGLAADKY